MASIALFMSRWDSGGRDTSGEDVYHEVEESLDDDSSLVAAQRKSWG